VVENVVHLTCASEVRHRFFEVLSHRSLVPMGSQEKIATARYRYFHWPLTLNVGPMRSKCRGTRSRWDKPAAVIKVTTWS
jgi:hypothetical protein